MCIRDRMKLQDAFNAAYFSELIDAVSLHVGGGVVLLSLIHI